MIISGVKGRRKSGRATPPEPIGGQGRVASKLAACSLANAYHSGQGSIADGAWIGCPPRCGPRSAAPSGPHPATPAKWPRLCQILCCAPSPAAPSSRWRRARHAPARSSRGSCSRHTPALPARADWHARRWRGHVILFCFCFFFFEALLAHRACCRPVSPSAFFPMRSGG